MEKNKKYRLEIDGLRAFAVIAVIINHFNKDILPNGYLGVDIFFVISGYVITSSLADRKSKNLIDFLTGFYKRRIKRLIPALIFFVVLSSIFICFFNFYPTTILRTGISSLFGLSNLYLIRRVTDYFAQSAELNIFTHTWSLGVEEQFYILFPFLVWFTGFGRQTKKGSRNLFLSVLFLAICSLISFIFLYSKDQTLAYFSMPTRFWEISTGCLLFITLKWKNKIIQNIQELPPIFPFLGILIVLFLPNSYAVLSTVGIVLLTAILISCLRPSTGLFVFLTQKRITYIGLISYSLYLWHWGILAISRWTVGVHWWSIPFQVGLIYLFSACSYKYIETPLRTKNWSNKRWKTLLKGIIALLFSGLSLLALEQPLKGKLYLGDPKKFYTVENEEIFGNPYFKSFKISKGCFNMTFDKEYSHKKVLNNCFEENLANRQTLFFLGDSHSRDMWLGSEFIAKKTNSNLFVLSFSGSTFPAINHFQVNRGPSCFTPKFNAFKSLESQIISQSKNGDVVFINLRFPYHFAKDWYEFPINEFCFFNKKGELVKRNSKEEHLEEWLFALDKFLGKLSYKNVKVVISSPIPEFPAAKLNKCKDQNLQWFNNLYAVGCAYPKTFFSSRYGKYFTIIKKLNEIAAKNKNLYIFDSLSTLCPNSNCERTYDGNPLYKDHTHISNYTSRFIIAPKMLRFIEKNQLIENK